MSTDAKIKEFLKTVLTQTQGKERKQCFQVECEIILIFIGYRMVGQK